MSRETIHFETKKRLVPLLRFKEFDGMWVEKNLGDVLDITSASRVHKDEWTEKGVPFFRSSDVVADFKGTENTKAYISLELYHSLSNKTGRVKKDDLLVTGGGSIGIPFLIKNNEPLYFKDADLLWIKNTNEISGYFLYSFFLTPSFKEYVKTISHVGTIAHYTVIQAKKTPFQFPSLPEQQKIASFLSAADEKIQQLTRKKELLEQYKKGVMQQLFSSSELGFAGLEDDRIDADDKNNPTILKSKKSKFRQLRFKDENGKAYPKWEEKRLGDVCVINPSSDKIPSSFIYIDLESVAKGQLIQERRIEKTDAPSRAQRKLLPNDILYQTVRPYQMNNYLFDKQGDYVASTGYAQIRTGEDTKYIYQLLHSEDFVNEVMERCTGTSFPAINSKDLGKIKVPIPHKEEQQKIANFLSAIDTKIESVATQIEKTQTFKKGLLQQMFV